MCDSLVFTLKGNYYMLGTGNRETDCNAEPNQLCENLTIQNQLNNIPITHIGDYAFRFRNRLKFIYIPNTIIFLGYDCFGYIYTLENVIFEERSNTSLVFDQGVFYRTNMTSIRLPNKILSEHDYVFSLSKIKNVIYCGMNNVYGSWFLEMSPPIIYVHPLYPYMNFANVTNLVFSKVCEVNVKCNCPSMNYPSCSFYRISILLNVIIIS